MACSKDFYQDEEIIGGYDLKLVKDKDVKLECSICLLLLRNAMGTPCSHVFCETCLQKLTKEMDIANMNFRCPDCNQKVSKIYPAPFVDRLVTGSDVFCSQREPGCNWTGTLASYFDKHDKECGYKFLSCQNDGCVFSCMRRSFVEHRSDCIYRMVQCDFCTLETKVIELEGHYSLCERMPILCPHDECESIMPRNEIEHHLKEECQLVLINCQYYKFGCTKKITRKDMEKHNQSPTNNHMNLMFNQIVQSKNEIDELRQQNVNSRNLFVQHQSQTKAEIEKQKEEIEKQREEIKELKGKLQNKVDKEIANCSKNSPSAFPHDIDELLSKGAEKWIRRKDIQCFDLSYVNWYTEIFHLMKQNKLYRSNREIYVKLQSKRRKIVGWYSNSLMEHNTKANLKDIYYHGDDGLIIRDLPNGLFLYTQTLESFNHQNMSELLTIHPQQQENMLHILRSTSNKSVRDRWGARNVPDDFYTNDFLILCLTT